MLYKLKRVKNWFRDDLFKKLIKNIITLISGNVGASMIGLVTLTLSINVLGTTVFGMFTLIQTYVVIFDGLLNFQSWEAIIKFGSLAKAENNPEMLKGYIKTGFLVDLISATIGTIFAILLVGIIGVKFNWTEDMIFFARLYSFTIFFNLSGTSIGVLRIYGKFKLFSMQKIICAVIKLSGVIIMFLLKGSLVHYVIITMTTVIMGNFILIGMAYNIATKNGIGRWWKSKIINGREFLKFAFWTNLNSTVALPFKEFDKIIVSLISYDAVAVYRLFKQISSMVGKIVSPVYQAIYPELAELIVKKQYKKGITVVKKIAFIVMGSGIILWCIVAPTSPYWLNWFFDDVIVEYWKLLALFLGFTVIGNSFVGLNPLFISMGFIRYNFILNVSGSVIYVLTGYFLTYHYGIIGVIIAGLIQSVFTNIIRIIILKTAIRNREIN